MSWEDRMSWRDQLCQLPYITTTAMHTAYANGVGLRELAPQWEAIGTGW